MSTILLYFSKNGKHRTNSAPVFRHARQLKVVLAGDFPNYPPYFSLIDRTICSNAGRIEEKSGSGEMKTM